MHAPTSARPPTSARQRPQRLLRVGLRPDAHVIVLRHEKLQGWFDQRWCFTLAGLHSFSSIARPRALLLLIQEEQNARYHNRFKLEQALDAVMGLPPAIVLEVQTADLCCRRRLCGARSYAPVRAPSLMAQASNAAGVEHERGRTPRAEPW